MQNEEKILELLESMRSDISALKEGQNNIINRLDGLDTKVDKINDRLEDMDSRNAANHMEIMAKLDELKNEVNFTQMATGKNMMDIAALKRVK